MVALVFLFCLLLIYYNKKNIIYSNVENKYLEGIMKIAIGADHAGFEFKEELKKFLLQSGHEVKDFGAYTFDKDDGFPDYAIPTAKAVAKGEYERGVLVCGSGIGVSIAANKVKGIRAVNCTCKEFAELSRKHNNTNVICFPGRFLDIEEAKSYLDVWLETEFLGGKYQERNLKIDSVIN